MGRLATRRAELPDAADILRQLTELRASWGDERPDGICDSLLEQLAIVRPYIIRERL